MTDNARPAAPPVTLGVPLAGQGAAPPRPDASPLSEADFLLVRQAALDYDVLWRTARRATRSAIFILSIGVLALPCSLLSGDWLGAVTAVGVCAVGVVELLAADRLRQGHLRATKLLCFNQVGFLTLIVAYCVIQIATFTQAKMGNALLSPEFRSALAGLPDMQKSIEGPIDRLAPLLMYTIYGGTIVLSALIQGNLARSYHACGRRMAGFDARTPAWVSRLLRETHAR